MIQENIKEDLNENIKEEFKESITSLEDLYSKKSISPARQIQYGNYT